MLAPGSTYRGFVVKKTTALPPPLGMAIELEHPASGARLLHLWNKDPENLFSIALVTPPPDDTGLPHILEHVVLCGSRKYPVRDPFFEMVKMSLATFINAMTFWDRTVYPVASNVKQDLFNLADVYFDAVFHPQLTEHAFKREGHHLAPAGEQGLTVTGIVYNEMKGAFSNPEAMLESLTLRYLFPDTVYGREAGGEPRCIPDLAFNAFQAFHATFYHPSNARFVLYGDIPTAEYLDFLADRLAAFEARLPRTVFERQPRWPEPRSRSETFAVGHGEPKTRRTYAILGWIAGDATDARETAALYLLSLLLFGHEAAPLKKALVDSKLGEDVIACGAETVGPELMFRVGLKGSEPDRTEAFAALVLDTLRGLADRPFSDEEVSAAFHQAGYEYQEIRSGYPLYVLFRVLQAWTYTDNPLRFLGMRETLRALRREFKADPTLFNRLIRERLLENPHRLLMTLRPDPDHQARLDAEFAERMSRLRAGLHDEALRRVAEEAEQLERESATPNSAKALASLPQLRRADLPPAPREIPTRCLEGAGGVPVLVNDVPSNGVVYLHLDFDLEGLPPDLWAWLPRYLEAFSKMGAAGRNFEEIARRRAAHVGALCGWPWFQSRADDPNRLLQRLRVELKTLDEHIEPALALLEDLLFQVDPRDESRLRDVLLQARAAARTNLVQDGAFTAILHAARGLSPSGFLRETVEGLPQLFLLEKAAATFEQEAAELMARIEKIRDFFLNRRRLAVSFTGSDESLEKVLAGLKRWVGRMRDEPVQLWPLTYPAFGHIVREGLAAPLQIAHCARVAPAIHYRDDDAPLLALGAHLLSYDYVLPEIRFKGNAYGAGCRHDPFSQTFIFSSYRDPHIVETLEVFERAADYVHQAGWDEAELDRAVIGKASEDLKPIRPGEATGVALYHFLAGLSPGIRAEHYRRRLRASPQEVRCATLAALEAGRGRQALCVMSSRENLEAANRRMSTPLSIEDVLKSE